MIKPDAKNIEEILSTSTQYAVPKYQRQYEWGKEEAMEFIADLEDYSHEGAGSLFLGTIIFDTKTTVGIVDGQQRLTTILVLLIACRELARKINDNALAQAIQQKMTFVDSATGESRGCKLIASESIRDIFEYMSSSDWTGDFPDRIEVGDGKKKTPKSIKRQRNKIKPIYDFFYKHIESYDKAALSRFLRALYSAYVVRIEIQDTVEAFSIFERTNARGVDLATSDLLKNHLFSQDLENIEVDWQTISSNSENSILRMLKYFYVSRNGVVTKSRLYKEIKKYGDNVGHARLVEELVDFSSFYKFIQSSEEATFRDYLGELSCSAIAGDQDKYQKIFLSVEALRLFKVIQIYPLIYSAITCFAKSGLGENAQKSKQLVRFFDVVEKYHFINTAICSRMGNEVEKLYADSCVAFNKSTDFEKTSGEIIRKLKEKLASEQEFTTAFVEVSYSANTIPLIAYIFDRINNHNLIPGQRCPIYISDPKVWRKNFNVEHFYPRKISDPKGPSLSSDALDSIGNLLVISFKTNSQLSNRSPEEKIAQLKGPLAESVSNLIYLNKFVSEYADKACDWNDDLVKDRANQLAIHSYKKVWHFEV